MRRAPPGSPPRAWSRELHIAAYALGYLGAAIAQDVERGGADHRAVVGAQARRRDAQRMTDALLDRGAQREVGRDATAEQHRLHRVLRGGARGLLREDLGDRLLERCRDVRDRDLALRLERAHEAQDRGLEAGEREVVAVGEGGARQRERVGVAVARDAL